MAEGYPAGALERVQRIETDILREVARVCEQLGIEWFADSGTVIGAVRHGGFIPWDDDIDISMRIDDFRLFCEKAPKLLRAEYGLYTHATTPNYPPLWAKVHRKGTRFMSVQMQEASFEQGLFVDVFAYAQLDSNDRRAASQIRRMGFWQRMSYMYYTANPKLPANLPCKPLFAAACKVANKLVRVAFSPQGIERRFYRAVCAGDGKGKWVDIFYPNFGTFDDAVLFPVSYAAFGDLKLPVPADTHAYLTTMYGNYMQLPPEEERGAYPPVVLDFGDGVNVMD